MNCPIRGKIEKILHTCKYPQHGGCPGILKQRGSQTFFIDVMQAGLHRSDPAPFQCYFRRRSVELISSYKHLHLYTGPSCTTALGKNRNNLISIRNTLQSSWLQAGSLGIAPCHGCAQPILQQPVHPGGYIPDHTGHPSIRALYHPTTTAPIRSWIFLLPFSYYYVVYIAYATGH